MTLLHAAGLACAFLLGFSLAAVLFASAFKRRKVIAAEEAERFNNVVQLLTARTQAEAEEAAVGMTGKG